MMLQGPGEARVHRPSDRDRDDDDDYYYYYYYFQDHWGLRTVEWAKFTHKGTGMLVDIIIIVLFIIIILITITIMIMKVDHFNTHLCVCNGDQLLGSAKTIADTIAANRRSPLLLIIKGHKWVMVLICKPGSTLIVMYHGQ